MISQPVTSCDDKTIPQDVILHRIVPRLQIVKDERVSGGWRPSTNAFKKGTRRGRADRMSVYLDDTLRDQFRSPDEYIDGDVTLGCLPAGFYRLECEQCVRRSPTVVDEAHGDVIGPERGALLKRMARAAACYEGEWALARRSAA
jgi:hypothetical protein